MLGGHDHVFESEFVEGCLIQKSGVDFHNFSFIEIERQLYLIFKNFLCPFNDILKSWNVLAKIFKYGIYIEGGAKRVAL